MGEPAIKVMIRDRDGLSARSRFDEPGICEAFTYAWDGCIPGGP